MADNPVMVERKPRRAKAKTKKRARTKKPAQPQPLPPPVPLSDPYDQTARELGLPILTTPESDRAQEAAQRGGVLGNLFGGVLVSPKPSPEPSPVMSSTPSPKDSVGSSAEPLSAEAERMLNGVPDTISSEESEQEPAGDLSDALPEMGGAELYGLMGDAIVDAEDMEHLLSMVGDTLANWRKREAYRIAGARAGSMAAKPWAMVVNTMWQRYAPQLLNSLCGNVPGLAKALLMTAIAFGPAVMEDVKQSRSGKSPVQDEKRGPVAVPRTPQAPNGGIVFPVEG